MSIAMNASCLQCNLRRNLETVQALGTDEQAMDFALALMRL